MIKTGDKAYTSATNYTDLDGNLKSFTFIDHDKKPTITTSTPLTDIEREDLKGWCNEYRKDLISRIINIPPIYCPMHCAEYTEHGDVDKITWRVNMLENSGTPLDLLRSLCTILENTVNP